MNKRISVLVCAMLMMSLVGLLVSPAQAEDIADNPDDRDDFVRLVSTTSDTGAAGDYIDCYVGEEDVRFGLEVQSLQYGDGTGKNVSRVWVELDVSAPISWENREETPGAQGADMSGTEPAANSTIVFGVDSDAWYNARPFEFDVDPDATPGEYSMTVTIHYRYVDETNTGQTTELETWILFDIMDNTMVDDGQPDLWAGEDFQPISFDVDPDAGTVNIEDTHVTLDEASISPSVDITIRDETAFIPGVLANPDTANYRFDVGADVPPDIYSVDYTLTAMRAGVEIEETGRVNFTVEYTPKIEVSYDPIEIEQGTLTSTFNVTFENVGNVDLSQVYVGLNDDQDYFPTKVEHYEYGDAVGPGAYLLGDGDLAIAGSESMTFGIGFHRYLQEGDHKLEFRWDGWYYNDGSTGDPSSYEHIGVDWADADPDTAFLYNVVADNHEYDNPGGDTIIGAADPWTEPYAMMSVVDEVIDMEGTAVGSVILDGDITYVQFQVTIFNYELVDFKDIEAVLNVGSGTPFFHPQDHTATTVEMDKSVSDTEIAAYDPATGDPGEADLSFNVDTNDDFVADTLSGNAHAYAGIVTINRMVNEDTLEEVTNQDVPIDGELEGLGPKMVVEGTLEDDKVKAGEMFNLTYTLSNHGDDVARDVWMTMQPELYDNDDWTIHDGFITAIASDNETMSMWGMSEATNTEYSEVTLENLGINDAKEIVELHMYVEGALSSPQPHIWTMYVGELAPGEEIEVTWQMVSDRDMEIGKPYQEDIEVTWMDSNGANDTQVFPTTIRTQSKGETYEPSSGFAGTSTETGLIIVFIIIVIALLLIVMMTTKKGGKKEEPEEETWEEPEPEPVMEEETVEEEPWGEPEEESWEEEPEEESWEEEPEEESWEEEPEEVEESKEEEVW
ncbi:MAG: hypothetical protein R6U61_06870 [Thermoplasmata archaeon]